MSRDSVVYVFWIILILFILSVLVVGDMLWPKLKNVSWYFMVVVGVGLLYLASGSMSGASGFNDLLNRMASSLADKVASY